MRRYGIRSPSAYFYSRPCGRGDRHADNYVGSWNGISTHAPAGGATDGGSVHRRNRHISTHAPAGGATRVSATLDEKTSFLLTPLREGRQSRIEEPCDRPCNFYSRPCGRGDRSAAVRAGIKKYFYSRPCGRGDARREKKSLPSGRFLLTPLREGRHFGCVCWLIHS